MKLNMMYGANIPYPYDVPNKTLDDGTPGIWTLIGAGDAVMDSLNPEKQTKNRVEVECEGKREDEL
jgi:hypothetical protein